MKFPNVPFVLPMVNAIYREHSAGCCLHNVLDDWNIEDSSVDFCAKYAAESGHAGCELLANTLRLMSRTQRAKLCKLKSR